MTSTNRLASVSFCLLCSFNAAVVPPAAARAAEPDRAPAIEHSVVKVFATMRYPDPFKPWTKQAPSEVTASGVVIEGKRILTNAHVVLYATQVQIQANGHGGGGRPRHRSRDIATR
jgi:S1-C subfamily serine protease